MSLLSEDHNPGSLKQTSQTFDAQDSDITFESCDNILFHIHRKNLEVHAAGFPPAEIDTRGEITRLTEDGATLELLFSFIYPKRHPDLETTPFEVLAPLAEAAEKYEVFSAMNICKVRMRNFLSDHALEIMIYGVKHDYYDIASLAAPMSLDIPLEKMVAALPSSMILPWVQFSETWSRRIISAFDSPPVKVQDNVNRVHYSNTCSTCNQDLNSAMRRMLIGLAGDKSLGALEAQVSLCFKGHISADAFMTHLRTQMGGIQKFETFL